VLAWLYANRTAQSAAIEQNVLRELFAERNTPVPVVLTDQNLQAYRVAYKRTVSLNEYIARSYLPLQDVSADPLTATGFRFISGRAGTDVKSALISSSLQQAMFPLDVRVRHPSEMAMRDFQKDPAILLGGPWIDPWGQLFEPKLNFQIFPPEAVAAASEIHNQNPIGGESAVYSPHREGVFLTSYARIAVVPNLGGNAKVVLIGSNTTEAMEAASDFLMHRSGLEELHRRFGTRNLSSLLRFEIVLEIRGVAQTPESARIVAQRPPLR
jgi:hypothetical protein